MSSHNSSLRSGRTENAAGNRWVLVAVEALPAGSKSLAAVSGRISAGERHDFGTAAPLSTRASSLEQGRVGGPVESSPKLVRRIGSVSTSAE